MILEHVAIWTSQLEILKDFYVRYFNAVPGQKYINPHKKFESYFLQFESGARLELMSGADIPNNLNDPIQQYLGIIHLAFGAETMLEVDQKAKEMSANGFPILSGPRKTGDGYYEFETLDPDNNRIEVTTPFRG